MIGLHSLFPPHQFSDWLNQLEKELKTDVMSRLVKKDPIEEIELIANGHSDNAPKVMGPPGVMPYVRGTTQQSNKWLNIFSVTIQNAIDDNLTILEALMNGVDCVRFDIRQTNLLNINELTKDIQFEYIQSQWVINSLSQWEVLMDFFNGELPQHSSIIYDHFEEKNEELFAVLTSYFRQNQRPFLHVNGFAYHECGSNAKNEVAFCLSVGNEYIESLLERGFTIDEAAACLSFSVGVGSNYFIEIAKIRALRWGWSTVISAYTPKHSCSHIMQINAEIGWLNKSLRDPNTNYLRQTTEAMSAVLGGVNGLLIHPFDKNAEGKSSVKANRMARTIPLILQDESFLDKVIDPLGGSYTIEQLTHEISHSAWQLFQNIHAQNGPSNNGRELMNMHLKHVRALRIHRMKSGEDKWIGINCYPNPTQETYTFSIRPTYMSFEFLQLEHHI